MDVNEVKGDSDQESDDEDNNEEIDEEVEEASDNDIESVVENGLSDWFNFSSPMDSWKLQMKLIFEMYLRKNFFIHSKKTFT